MLFVVFEFISSLCVFLLTLLLVSCIVAHVICCDVAFSARGLGNHASEDVDRPAPVRYGSGLAVVRRLPSHHPALGNWYFFKIIISTVSSCNLCLLRAYLCWRINT